MCVCVRQAEDGGGDGGVVPQKATCPEGISHQLFLDGPSRFRCSWAMLDVAVDLHDRKATHPQVETRDAVDTRRGEGSKVECDHVNWLFKANKDQEG